MAKHLPPVKVVDTEVVFFREHGIFETRYTLEDGSHLVRKENCEASNIQLVDSTTYVPRNMAARRAAEEQHLLAAQSKGN